MTTIIADARAGLMASDSQWSDGDAIGSVRKVFRVRGELVGFAGTVEDITTTLAWFRSGFSGPPPRDDCVALILRRSGIYTWSPVDGEMREDAPFFAIGTGGKCARAAMLAGADCRKAIRIASTIDAETGGRVRVYKLEK